MFKITGRIVLILLAASLVAGALYLLVNGVSGQPGLLGSLDRRGGFNDGIRGGRQTNVAGLLIQGVPGLDVRSDFGGGGFRGDRFSLGRGISGVVADLITIALITLLVVLIHGAVKKALALRRRRV